MGWFDFLFEDTPMKASHAVKAAAPRRKAGAVEMRPLEEGVVVVYYKPTTPEKRRAAVDHLLRTMPPPVKPGEKPAHELLAEYRAGK